MTTIAEARPVGTGGVATLMCPFPPAAGGC